MEKKLNPKSTSIFISVRKTHKREVKTYVNSISCDEIKFTSSRRKKTRKLIGVFGVYLKMKISLFFILDFTFFVTINYFYDFLKKVLTLFELRYNPDVLYLHTLNKSLFKTFKLI